MLTLSPIKGISNGRPDLNPLQCPSTAWTAYPQETGDGYNITVIHIAIPYVTCRFLFHDQLLIRISKSMLRLLSSWAVCALTLIVLVVHFLHILPPRLVGLCVVVDVWCMRCDSLMVLWRWGALSYWSIDRVRLRSLSSSSSSLGWGYDRKLTIKFTLKHICW
jgi:hypothetical protein